MAKILVTVLYFAILLGVTFGILLLGRKFVFSKVRVNKFVPLALAIIFFIGQMFLPKFVTITNSTVSMVVSAALTVITVTFFLWFMEIVTTGGPRAKEKQIEIRPKAKPNRVKHLQNKDKK